MKIKMLSERIRWIYESKSIIYQLGVGKQSAHSSFGKLSSILLDKVAARLWIFLFVESGTRFEPIAHRRLRSRSARVGRFLPVRHMGSGALLKKFFFGNSKWQEEGSSPWSSAFHSHLKQVLALEIDINCIRRFCNHGRVRGIFKILYQFLLMDHSVSRTILVCQKSWTRTPLISRIYPSFLLLSDKTIFRPCGYQKVGNYIQQWRTFSDRSFCICRRWNPRRSRSVSHK